MITSLLVRSGDLRVEGDIIRSSIIHNFVSELLMIEMGNWTRGKDDSGLPVVCVCVPMQQNASEG
jgi:hypothetical protein